jgi:hypothetical protein
MVEGEDWLDSMSEKLIDERVIESESSVVDVSAAARMDARPTHRESVGLESHFRHQRDVFLVLVIVADSHIAVGSLERLPGDLAEDIPDGGSLSVSIPGSLHLIRGRRCAPQEIRREWPKVRMQH